MKKKIKIFILVGEDSGDFIASQLIKGFAIKKVKNIEFHGVTGQRMKKLNVKSVFDFRKINVIGFKEILLNFFVIKKKINFLSDYIINLHPDIVITIDAKVFSLNLANSLKKKFHEKKIRIPLIHFVPPTIWAHSPQRARKWNGLHDKLISLIPNEKEFFKKFSIDTTYIGNPTFENLITKIINTNNKINNMKKKICLILPGSRNKEILHNIDTLLKSIKLINYKYPSIDWYLPSTKNFKFMIKNKLKEFNLEKQVKIIDFNKDFSKIINAKVAIACSGAVTLELALAGIPTIGVYKTDWLNGIIAKFIVNKENVILPNFIVGKEIIPFLFQEKCNPENIYSIFQDFYNKNKFYKKKFTNFSEMLVNKMDHNAEYKTGTFAKNAAVEILSLIK